MNAQPRRCSVDEESYALEHISESLHEAITEIFGGGAGFVLILTMPSDDDAALYGTRMRLTSSLSKPDTAGALIALANEFPRANNVTPTDCTPVNVAAREV